jgi:hypothetical protein
MSHHLTSPLQGEERKRKDGYIMQSITLQQLVTLFLPFVAALISYGLQQAHWPQKTNTLIAGGSIILATIATLLVQGKLTGDIYSDALLVMTASTALQAEALQPLQQYLRQSFPVQPQPQLQTSMPQNEPETGENGPAMDGVGKETRGQP